MKHPPGTKFFMRVTDARGMNVYGMPGGRVFGRAQYGVLLPIAGQGVYFEPEDQYYFPVQVDQGQVGMSIVWASQRGFVILRRVPE